MTENARALFLHLQDLPITDRYAAPRLPKRVLTNATELLRTPQKDRMISLTFENKKCNISTMSDFEYFSLLLRLIPEWTGTREGEFVPYEFLALLGNSGENCCFDDKDRCENAWKIANEKLLLIGGDYEALLKNNGVEKLYDREAAIDGFYSVEKYNDNGDALSLLCDFRGLPFCRPDPYHATCAEEKHGRGEPLTDEEESLLVTQNIYRLCAKASQRVEIRALFDADGKTANELVAYLKRQSIRGTLWIAADGGMSVDTLFSLCDLSDDTLEIRPEIVLGPYDSRYCLEQRLHRLAARYPMTRWRFGGVLGDDPLFFVGHVYMREVLCDVVAKIVDEPTEAERILKHMLAPL